MKYGIPVNHNGVVILEQVFEIPESLPDWANGDASFFAHKMFPQYQGFIQVGDANVSGAIQQPDGSYLNPAPPPQPVPKPNNPGNPYFGKPPLARKDFFALVGQILPADRYKRLTTDSHFLWVKDVLDGIDTVDVDDKGGQFLKISGYLTTTAADDGKPLMETAERDAIMQAWK